MQAVRLPSPYCLPVLVELAPAAIGRAVDLSFPFLFGKSLMDPRSLPAAMMERELTITLLEASLFLIEMLCEMIVFFGEELRT